MEVKQVLTQVKVSSGQLYVLSNSCFCTRHTYMHAINSNACIAGTLHFCFRLKPLELQTSWLQNTKIHLIAKYMLTGRKNSLATFVKAPTFRRSYHQPQLPSSLFHVQFGYLRVRPRSSAVLTIQNSFPFTLSFIYSFISLQDFFLFLRKKKNLYHIHLPPLSLPIAQYFTH